MSKYKRVQTIDYEASGTVAVAAVSASYASMTTAAAATVAVAGATAGIYYASVAPSEAVQASCAVLPTCAKLGFF